MSKKVIRTGDILTIHVGTFHVDIKVSGASYQELQVEVIGTRNDCESTGRTRYVELYG
jgi:hypothetical protein